MQAERSPIFHTKTFRKFIPFYVYAPASCEDPVWKSVFILALHRDS